MFIPDLLGYGNRLDGVGVGYSPNQMPLTFKRPGRT